MLQSSNHPEPRSGFTLLEVLVAMVILSIALTVAWQTFSTAVSAWTSGREQMDRMHHGGFVLTRLTAALRSTAFFDSAPEKYGFRMKRNAEGIGEHTISWVTASDAFIPPGSELAHGLHRIEVGAGRNTDGDEGLLVRAWPHLADEEEIDPEQWLVSETIRGLRCRVYDTDRDSEGWRDDWEDTNEIPGLVELTLYAEAADDYAEPLEFRQLIKIPLGPEVTNIVSEAN